MNIAWRIFVYHLRKVQLKYDIIISAFVLMPNHYHLILRTPMANLDVVMRDFHKCVTDEINFRADTINHIFGSRYRWSLVTNRVHLVQLYKYVLRNPVKAVIVERCESYPYSSYYYSDRKIFLPFMLEEIFYNDEYLKRWLNHPFTKEQASEISYGISKKEFVMGQGGGRGVRFDTPYNVSGTEVPDTDCSISL